MNEKPEKTLREHLKEAARARWAKTTPEERAAHARTMNTARWGKEHGATDSTSTGGETKSE